MGPGKAGCVPPGKWQSDWPEKFRLSRQPTVIPPGSLGGVCTIEHKLGPRRQINGDVTLGVDLISSSAAIAEQICPSVQYPH